MLTWEALRVEVDAFLEETGHKNDGFWDDGIYAARPHRLEGGGFYAIGDWAGAPILHAFWMPRERRRLAQALFDEVCRVHNVDRALVASNDELFLCLAFERMHSAGGAFEMQAYNLTFGAPIRPAAFGRACFSLVPERAYSLMHTQTEGQWAGEIPLGAAFYKVEAEDELLGYGAIYPRMLDPGCADVGNYVLPAHRRKGVGRSILIQLSQIVIDSGKKPTAGCWYYNHNSIRTLNSAGFIPDTRLFNITFGNGKPEAFPYATAD